jgi:hypothetical protein
MDKIALAKRAPGEELDGIHSTHVRFDYGHEIALVRVTQLLKGKFRRPYPYSQTRA